MEESVLVSVVVDQTVFSIDKPYDYFVPSELQAKAKLGCRVTVPFGNGNRKKQGLIIGFSDNGMTEKTKMICSVVDENPILNEELLKLVEYIKEYNLCTWYDAVKCILPPGINYKFVSYYSVCDETVESDIRKLPENEMHIARYLYETKMEITADKLWDNLSIEENQLALSKLLRKGILKKRDEAVRKTRNATLKMVRISQNEDINFTEKQKKVLNLLKDMKTTSAKELCYFAGVTEAVLSGLEKKGAIEFYAKEYYRRPYNISPVNKTEIILTSEQQNAYNKLLDISESGKPEAVLLYGITGSGKTQVFLKLCQSVLKKGKGIIVMVPEISLTPQTLSIFNSMFGDDIAVFHSAMSQGQRLDEWRRVNDGKARIAIGTRTAVFAPIKNLGLIIMDEEQEHTYKSEKSPRFHARDVARFRAADNNALLLLSSATPSIESFTAALNGRYKLLRLQNRYGNAVLPEVIKVDMRAEIARGNTGAISSTLYDYLQDTLSSGNQAILLLNRRGYNTFVTCPACGHVVTCENCSISMTYHSANNRLMCHSCGASAEYTDKCPICGGSHLKYMGFGTQKLEKELEALFPTARILRMDADSTMTREAFENGFSSFANGEYDIMLGTQMVAKGLDFPRVTLVGVVGADQSMYSDDFRSFEKTFSLLTQVVGRSGRGEQKGVAVIQTVSPDSPVIELAASQNYDEFYNHEIRTRKLMLYPPFCDITLLCIQGPDRAATAKAATALIKSLKILLESEFKTVKLIALGPVIASIPKVNNKYRYKITVKSKNTREFRNMLRQLLLEKSGKDISIFADINPEGTI